MTTAISASFQNYLIGKDRSPNTIRCYLQDLSLFARWFEQSNGEQLDMRNLTTTDARLYRQYLQDRVRSKPATINRRLAMLRSFGEAMKSQGFMPTNPVGEVRGITSQELGPKWLDRRQQMSLCRQLERETGSARSEAGQRQAIRDRAAICLLLNTGLRIGELCDLELGDLELSERKGMVQVREGKGQKARKVPLNRTARASLRAWLERRPEGGGKVFKGKRGEDLTSHGLRRRLEDIGRRAGLEATPHHLRHTFAKNLVEAGVSLEKVAMLLGHSNLNTTRIYTVPSQNDLAEAVERLDL